jgi:hypothetical protein
MNFSRRKLMQPLPPSPALTRIDTSSTNFIQNRLSSDDESKNRKPEALAKMSAAAPYEPETNAGSPNNTALQEAHHKRKSPVA